MVEYDDTKLLAEIATILLGQKDLMGFIGVKDDELTVQRTITLTPEQGMAVIRLFYGGDPLIDDPDNKEAT